MVMGLNYEPEDVKTTEVMIASVAGSGVAFGVMPHKQGEEPRIVAIAPRVAKLNDLRIGDTVEVGYVPNFPEHVERVPFRAVAVYRKTDGAEKPTLGLKPSEMRRTIEQQVQDLVTDGGVWNRGMVYEHLFGEPFVSVTASEAERSRYEAVGHSMMRLHETGVIACAKVYGPSKKNATAIFYGKSTNLLCRSLSGAKVQDEGEQE